MISLTYFGVHLAFILPPILVLGWLARRRPDAWWGERPLSGLGIIVVLALVYTTPWTNHLIPRGVWWYGEGVVIATVWHTPIEEYLFFALQPVLTAFWLFQVPVIADRPLSIRLSHRLLGVAGGAALAGVGWLLTDTASTYYLGWLLLWAGPVFAIQWGFGLTYLWELRRSLLVAVAVPTVYLWLVDWIALERGVWAISETHTIGFAPLGVPVEELLFFLVTNLFVVQGIVMYMWLLECREDVPSLTDARGRLGAGSDER
ncbi:lycopene beta-cyclase [Natronobiforma cellulositropha]